MIRLALIVSVIILFTALCPQLLPAQTQPVVTPEATLDQQAAELQRKMAALDAREQQLRQNAGSAQTPAPPQTGGTQTSRGVPPSGGCDTPLCGYDDVNRTMQ
jgi:hypothetical protein